MKDRYWKRRGASMLLAAAMAFTAMPDACAYAGEAQENLTIEREISKSGEAHIPVYRLVKKGKPSKSGYQEMVWVDEDGNEMGKEEAYEAPRQKRQVKARASFPSSYSMLDTGELPAVRSQGQWGTCWAHAALCSVESNMVKKGLADVAAVDYSERHLVYFSHRRNETLGDGEDIFHDTYSWYGGGNHYSAAATLGSWSGAAQEQDYPYVSYGEMEDLAESDRMVSVCHLTDANILSAQEDVKRAVMNTGAVMCSYYSGDGTIQSAQENVYHAETASVDHSVNIVGWDDDYLKTNFHDNGRMPENNGAWLCRNSWGPDWGENGYFWISYEDATLTDFCSFEVESPDNYDHIYQYDGAGWNFGVGAEKAANIFTAESVEKLRAVSFYTYANWDYQIEIYAGIETPVNLPSDGVLVYSQTGTAEHSGYHTVLLDEEVLLAAGMKYAVAMELTSKDGAQTFFFGESGDAFSSEAGQSFLLDGGRWKDMQEYGYQNLCIKAFTDDVERVDKSELLELIEGIETLKGTDYTADTWADLCVKLEQAKAVYQSAGEVNEQVIKAMLDLKDAKEALVKSSVYLSDEDEFEAFAQAVSSGKDYDGQTVYLLNDLDMTGITHREIGNSSVPFMGTFDGGGHTIANLVYTSSYSYGGLFGWIGEKGIVKDIKLTNVKLTLGASFSGGMAGVNEGVISGCSMEGNVRIESDNGVVGGVVGENRGRLEKSSLNGTLLFQNQRQKEEFAGGIAGHNQGSIDRCFIEGQIVSDGLASTGGIVGYSDEGSEISRCYNLASISGTPSEETRTAGIGVCLYGNTYDCYNYGEIRRRAGDEYGAVYCYKGAGNISNCYYRNISGIRGGYSPFSSAGSMTAGEFASAKAAYYLNSSGGTGANTYEWSQKNGVPIWADDANKAVIKVIVRQSGEKGASLNGVAEGEFYAKGGTEVELRSPDAVPGYQVSVEVTGLTRSGKSGTWYLLPEKDTSVRIRYQKTPIQNEFRDGRKEMTGIGYYQVLDANKKTAVLTEVVNKKAAKLNVPATVKIAGVTCKVTAIGDRVFKNGSMLKKVILGKYVTTIGKQAFMNCKKLKNVQLKGSALKTIKTGAFKKTAAKITVSAKKMKKKQKAALLKKLKRAGISKKAKVK